MASDLRGALIAPKPVHRAAITTATEAGELLRAIETFEGSSVVHAALKLLPHVFVRPGELRFAEWSDFDLEKAVWTIPPHETKMRRAHSVPLSAQALAIVCSIKHDAEYSPYLFSSRTSVDRPMSENTVNAALRRLGYSQDMTTGHGFRAMAATLLNEMSLWHADAIERQLAHCDANAVPTGLYPRRVLGLADSHDATLIRTPRLPSRRSKGAHSSFRRRLNGGNRGWR